MKIFSVWRRVVLSLISMGNRPAKRPAAEEVITGVLTQYHVKRDHRDKFLEVLGEYIFSARHATGNRMAEAYYEQGDDTILWIIERWNDYADYKNNKRSDATKAVRTLARGGLASPIETIFIKDLELLSKEQIPIANDLSLTVMLFIDLKAGTEEDFISINQVLMSAFRHAMGVLTFRLSQVVNDSTSFIVYKKFRNREAFQHHLKDPAVEPVMSFLQTSVKEAPFERGYHHLIEFAPKEAT